MVCGGKDLEIVSAPAVHKIVVDRREQGMGRVVEVRRCCLEGQ